jgi:hypothetical protein
VQKGFQVSNKFQAFGIDNPNFESGRTPRIIKLSYVAIERIAGDPLNDPSPVPANGSWSLNQQNATTWTSFVRDISENENFYAICRIETSGLAMAEFVLRDSYGIDQHYLTAYDLWPARQAICYHFNPFPTRYDVGQLFIDWIDIENPDTITTRAAELFPIQGKQFLDNLPQPDGTIIHRYSSKFDASCVKIRKNT